MSTQDTADEPQPHLALWCIPFNKNSCLKFWKFHTPNGTVHSSCTDLKPKPLCVWVGTCKQDTDEQEQGQQLRQIERVISVIPVDYLQSCCQIFWPN